MVSTSFMEAPLSDSRTVEGELLEITARWISLAPRPLFLNLSRLSLNNLYCTLLEAFDHAVVIKLEPKMYKPGLSDPSQCLPTLTYRLARAECLPIRGNCISSWALSVHTSGCIFNVEVKSRRKTQLFTLICLQPSILGTLTHLAQ